MGMGTTFTLFFGAGAILGILFGFIVAMRDRYGDLDLLGGFLTFLTVMVIAAICWFFYGLYTYRTHPIQAAFIYPPVHLVPNQLSGWICLALYLLIHLTCYGVQNAPNEHLSRAHPSGPTQEIIERCYQSYSTALVRFSPRPITQFFTPVDLCFHEVPSTEITWDGQALVIPKQLMYPENEGVLRPMLACQMMYFNGPDLRVKQFLNSYPHPLLGFALMLTGNFLVLPALVQEVAGARWRGERVLDADRYAFLLGQGEVLRHLLKLEQEELQAKGIIDTNFPTFSERIDQLDALINDEHEQMRQLGIPIKQQPNA
jgi:hypothetical protein